MKDKDILFTLKKRKKMKKKDLERLLGTVVTDIQEIKKDIKELKIELYLKEEKK